MIDLNSETIEKIENDLSKLETQTIYTNSYTRQVVYNYNNGVKIRNKQVRDILDSYNI